MITIGDMKHRARFQESIRLPDGAGGFTQTWQDIATEPEVFAAVESLTTSERFRHRQMQKVVTHRLVVRFRADVTPALRVAVSGVAYDIVAISDRDGDKTWLEILAQEASS